MRELLARIDSRELTAWVAYEKVTGPVGPERADAHTAIIASTIANAMRAKKGRRHKPEDFLPKWDHGAPPEPRPEQTEQDQLRLVQRLNKKLGGRLIKKRGVGSDGDSG